jgi:DNA-binding GntR family transcriptional regulator
MTPAGKRMRKLQRSNLSEAAYTEVKAVLVSARYSPGDRIPVEELSRELGVSRTPVWDALNRLEAEGMVEIVPRKGVFLLNFSPEKAREIYQVRECLEGMVARLAAVNLTARHHDFLKQSLERQSACISDRDVTEYADATIKFHNFLVEAAGNKTLERLLMSVYAQSEALRLRTMFYPARVRASFQEHQRMVAALLKNDPDLAEKEARAHIRMTMDQALELSAGTYGGAKKPAKPS